MKNDRGTAAASIAHQNQRPDPADRAVPSAMKIADRAGVTSTAAIATAIVLGRSTVPARALASSTTTTNGPRRTTATTRRCLCARSLTTTTPGRFRSWRFAGC
uniref:(northern house mosquito) hypothetical protein n=1 Tax=Culex pipiens TaxID=7175 RepID=A0A8D8CXH7_CULPI